MIAVQYFYQFRYIFRSSNKSIVSRVNAISRDSVGSCPNRSLRAMLSVVMIGIVVADCYLVPSILLKGYDDALVTVEDLVLQEFYRCDHDLLLNTPLAITNAITSRLSNSSNQNNNNSTSIRANALRYNTSDVIDITDDALETTTIVATSITNNANATKKRKSPKKVGNRRNKAIKLIGHFKSRTSTSTEATADASEQQRLNARVIRGGGWQGWHCEGLQFMIL